MNNLGAALGQLPLGEIVSAAKNGSPSVLALAGRALGLGNEDQQALAAGKVPWWAISVSALLVGYMVGVRTGSSAPSWIKGK